MNAKILLILGALILVVTGVVVFFYKSGAINIDVPVTEETVETEQAGVAGFSETDVQEPAAAKEITRINSGINTKALEVVANNMTNAALPTDADYWGIANDMLPKFAETLNAIFGGDDKLLSDTFREQMGCGRNDYRSLEDVERGVASIREQATQRMSQGGGNPERLGRMVSGMELRALEQVEDCGWRHQSAAQQLRAEVARRAQGGDVMARFVYATMLWPSPHEDNYPEEHAAWAQDALKFSEQNAMEGWSVGFEAMEMSANWGLFSPVSRAMAQAWGIVLTTCPIAGPAPIGSDWNSRFRGMSDFSNSAPIHAARLIEQHCPGASAGYTPPDIVSVEQRRP